MFNEYVLVCFQAKIIIPIGGHQMVLFSNK